MVTITVTRLGPGGYPVGIVLYPVGVYQLNGDAGSYSISGAAAGFAVTEPLSLGTYTLSGQPAALLTAHILDGAAGAYSVTGNAAGLSVTLPFAIGSYAITGASAALLAAHVLDGATGSYSINGAAAAFVVTEPLTLGTYTINGAPASLLATHILDCAPGSSYGIAGASAGLLTGHVLAAAVGTYSITGAPAGLLAPHVLDCDAGAYTIAGAPSIGLLSNPNVVVTPAQGFQPGIGGGDGTWLRPRRWRPKYAAAPLIEKPREPLPPRYLTLAAHSGVYSMTGRRAGLFREGYVLQTDPGMFKITGAPADGSIKNRAIKMSDERKKRQIAIDNAFLLAS